MSVIANRVIEKELTKDQLLHTVLDLIDHTTTMMGCIDGLKHTETDPKKRLYLENASSSGTTMMTLLTTVSDLSTLEQGSLSLEESVFSPIEVFSTLPSLFYEKIHKGELSFYLFVDPNLPNTIYSDPHRLKQILIHLIDNAITSTPTYGAITVEITYEPRDCVMIFSVEETGIGIDEPQPKASMQEAYGGRGLQLAISAKLAERLGTHLERKRTETQGSRFSFSLPLTGKIRDGSFSFDLSLIATFRPILIFDKTHFPIRKLLLRYLKSFGCGIENIMILNAWKQIEGITPTHIFCDDENIHPKWIQPLLDKGVKLIVIPNTLLEETLHDLTGDVSRIASTFNLTQLYHVLKQGQSQNNVPIAESLPLLQREGYVLIVDSNALNIKFLSEMGKKFGLEILTATDEHDAMQMYINGIEANHPFNLILMDEMMNETEMATSILKFEEEYQLEHTPIIAIKRNITPEEKSHELPMLGIDQYLFEPITIKKLSELFDHYLSKNP